MSDGSVERTGECPVCDLHDAKISEEHDGDLLTVCCDRCGEFGIVSSAVLDLQRMSRRDPIARDRVSRYVWEKRSEGSLLVVSEALGGFMADEWHGSVASLKNIVSMYEDDGSPLDKYEGTIRRLGSLAKPFGYMFSFVEDRWAVPTLNADEAEAIVEALIGNGYLDGDSEDFRLTVQGLQYAAELSRDALQGGNTVFVAACFSEELAGARKVIHDVVEGLGYDAMIVNEIPHNDLIDLQIYEGIRESHFVVADLTCNRQSVYYEVGFAHGLDIDVVLTCRSDCMKDANDDSKRVHFDLNHRNILVWNDEAELAEMLRLHILQSFGKAG